MKLKMKFQLCEEIQEKHKTATETAKYLKKKAKQKMATDQIPKQRQNL